MKKIVLVALFMTGLTTFAQREIERERGEMNRMTPEQAADLQTKKMTLALDLTAAQQEKVKALHLENAKMRQAKMEEHAKAKASGEAKKPNADQRYAMQNEKLDRMIAQKAEMKRILTPEQYAKWEKNHQHYGEHGSRKGKRGDGHKRGNSQEGQKR